LMQHRRSSLEGAIVRVRFVRFGADALSLVPRCDLHRRWRVLAVLESIYCGVAVPSIWCIEWRRRRVSLLRRSGETMHRRCGLKRRCGLESGRSLRCRQSVDGAAGMGMAMGMGMGMAMGMGTVPRIRMGSAAGNGGGVGIRHGLRQSNRIGMLCRRRRMRMRRGSVMRSVGARHGMCSDIVLSLLLRGIGVHAEGDRLYCGSTTVPAVLNIEGLAIGR